MRIPQVDKETNLSGNLSLSPQVRQLIEKLANTPLLIQKLILNQQATIQLDIEQNTNLKQIQIPLNTAKTIASIANSPINANLTIRQNKVELQLSAPITNMSQKLLFKQAKLSPANVLQLSLPIPTKQANSAIDAPLTVPSQISIEKNTAVSNMPPSSPSVKGDLTLQQAISFFLKSKPVENQPLSSNLNHLLNNIKALTSAVNASSEPILKPSTTAPQQQTTSSILPKQTPADSSAKTAVTLRVKPQLDNTSHSSALLLTNPKEIKLALTEQQPIKLLNNDLEQVLQKLTTDQTDNKLVLNLKTILSTTRLLKQALDFSENNKQLKLANRLTTSGNFFESGLVKSITEDTTKKPLEKPTLGPNLTQSKATKNLNPLEQNLSQIKDKQTNQSTEQKVSSSDIKQLTLSLQKNLQSLLQQLNRPAAQAVLSSRLIGELKPTSLIIEKVTPPPIEDSRTQSTVHPVNKPATHNSPPLSTKSLVSPSIESTREKAPFLSAKELVNLKGFRLNLKQEEVLLNTQKKILNSMLAETNSIINKIETNQLLSLKSDIQLQQQLLLDLPIFHQQKFESFEILLTSKNNSNQEEEATKQWTVTVKFDLQPLGPMFARISLKHNRISTHFFAKEEATAMLLKDNIQHLERSLFLAGLDIEEIQGQQGVVPDKLLSNHEHSVDLRV